MIVSSVSVVEPLPSSTLRTISSIPLRTRFPYLLSDSISILASFEELYQQVSRRRQWFRMLRDLRTRILEVMDACPWDREVL